MQGVFPVANFFAGQKKCVVLFIKQDDRTGNVFCFLKLLCREHWHLDFTVSWPPSVVNAHLALTSDSNQIAKMQNFKSRLPCHL